MNYDRKILSFSDYFLCAVLALAFTSSPYYINTGTCKISVAYCVTAVVSFTVLILITWLLRSLIKNNIWKLLNRESRCSAFVSVFMKKKNHVSLLAGVMLLIWLLFLLCLFPGTLINDTWSQLQQFMTFTAGEGVLSDHHPIFDTLIMGVLIVPLSQLTNYWHLVIWCYVLLQSYLTCLAFSYTINYVYRKLDLNSNAVIVMFSIYSIWPLYPASAQTVSKDALFSWIFVFFTLEFMEIVRSEGTVLKKEKFIIKFIALAIMCSLTKKVGVYVILLSLFCLFLFLKNYRKRIGFSFLCISVFMLGVMPAVKNNLNVIPGGKQEMFSLPFQQTARYVKYHSDDITKEEYAVIDRLLCMENLADRYNPTVADPVKGYQERGSTEDYIAYIKVWLSQGIRHFGTYLVAFNAMEAGWFSWQKYDPLMNMDWHNCLNPEMIPEWVSVRNDFSIKTADAIQEIYNNLYDIPLLTILLSYGFYASIVPAFSMATVLRKWNNKKIKYWLGLIPIYLSLVLGCWLAPTSVEYEGRRYLYPITYTMPIMLAWSLYVYKVNLKKGNE